MHYLLCVILEVLLIVGSKDANLESITPWLLGINFTIAVFSINFSFFGHQLSKYKAIYTQITKRQWINIITLLVLPFLPLVSFLFFPEYFEKIALLVLPILVLSSLDSAKLTSNYLSPHQFIESLSSDKAISQYLRLMSAEVQKDLDQQDVYLKDKDKFQIPPHAYDFEAGILGLEPNDLWDSLTVISKLSVENNDYPVFRRSLNAILKLVLAFYSFQIVGEDSYKVESAVRNIAQKRFRSVIACVCDADKNGVFLQTLYSEICSFLMKDEMLNNPCSDITRAIAADAVWIGRKMLESKNVVEPIKILNTIHRVIELGIYRLEQEASTGVMRQIDKHNISAYAYDIKVLGVSALYNENPHFAYRCMETLSYLGCNAAKLKSMQTVIAVFESIVQLGRVAKHLNIGCFWQRCLIPFESHAEEFMGHILTWLVQDLAPSGSFYMKGYTEQAYSRLRGVRCVIKPKANLNPCFWLQELELNGEKQTHIEYESGMWGYGGKLDYSDFSNLKEYVLHGIGGDSEICIAHSLPIPINLENDDPVK